MHSTPLDAHTTMHHNSDFSGDVLVSGIADVPRSSVPARVTISLSPQAMGVLVEAYLSERDKDMKIVRGDAIERGLMDGRRYLTSEIFAQVHQAIDQALTHIQHETRGKLFSLRMKRLMKEVFSTTPEERSEILRWVDSEEKDIPACVERVIGVSR